MSDSTGIENTIETKENENIGQSEQSASGTAESEQCKAKEDSAVEAAAEDGDQTEEETEPILTIQDILDNEASSRETARVLLGAQDSSVCTYPEGYKPRQAVFACLTCAPEPEKNEAGVCYGCSIHCHDGHNIVELFTKRKFRCDCGNSKFKTKCTLYEDKEATNTENTYNDNFIGLFCHLDEKCAAIAEEKEKSDQMDFSLICKDCAKRLPFLSLLNIGTASDGKEPICFSTAAEPKEGPYLLVDGFRQRMCRCTDCSALYERAGCEFFIDTDDDIELFTKENIEKTEGEKEPDDETIVNELVQTAGRDAAIHVLKGYFSSTKTKLSEFYCFNIAGFNELKRNLHEFMREKQEEGVGVITAEHITSFFDKIKRSRLEDTSGDDV
ncbi:putative zinc finger in N-recognin [Oesophagostomum dentatum]|uniref:Putative zinc finger in N-recognin n=1 Tax=Oesophagostomum dentatum TaxID=61180 RepID=A0A0B1T2H3_OESDE|nr:putative zinc finger in N-recognin [Oesophagostomum dentatum]